MSEEMDRAIIFMPFDLAMSSELSRRQFYARAQCVFVEREGENERAKMLLKAKNEWADRARNAEEERDQLLEKIERVRSRKVSLDFSKEAVIPNALDAWGRPVLQHLPYDIFGKIEEKAIQYCNGWNDSGGYWKAHCVDLQAERDALRAEVEMLRRDAGRYRWLRDKNQIDPEFQHDALRVAFLAGNALDSAIDAELAKGDNQ